MQQSGSDYNRGIENNLYYFLNVFEDDKQELSRINTLCSHFCGTTTSVISIMDDQFQYTLSSSGNWKFRRLPLDQSICRHTATSGAFFSIGNTLTDRRTRNLPYVADNSVRFYAGVPIKLDKGDVVGSLCVMHDEPKVITRQQKQALEILADQLKVRFNYLLLQRETDHLQDLLNSRDIQFYEIHHRIKNNLADICGMLQMEWFENPDPTVRRVLSRTESRIVAIMKLHEVLYESDELLQSNLKTYLEKLTHKIVNTTSPDDLSLDLQLDIDEIHMGITQSFSLGLILNEMISNSIRHAFESDDQASIHIEIHEDDQGDVQFSYSDNGKGIDLKGKKLADFGNMGMKLIDLLTQQLHGSISLNGEKGTTFLITFRNDQQKQINVSPTPDESLLEGTTPAAPSGSPSTTAGSPDTHRPPASDSESRPAPADVDARDASSLSDPTPRPSDSSDPDSSSSSTGAGPSQPEASASSIIVKKTPYSRRDQDLTISASRSTVQTSG